MVSPGRPACQRTAGQLPACSRGGHACPVVVASLLVIPCWFAANYHAGHGRRVGGRGHSRSRTRGRSAGPGGGGVPRGQADGGCAADAPGPGGNAGRDGGPGGARRSAGGRVVGRGVVARAGAEPAHARVGTAPPDGSSAAIGRTAGRAVGRRVPAAAGRGRSGCGAVPVAHCPGQAGCQDSGYSCGGRHVRPGAPIVAGAAWRTCWGCARGWPEMRPAWKSSGRGCWRVGSSVT